VSTPTDGAARGAGSWRGVPNRPIGWVAAASVPIALAAWVVLPMITTMFGETVPVTDTALMPIIGVTITLIAAVLNILALTVWRQRNVLNLIGALLAVPVALVFLVFLIGEGIGGE
jgi:hypothetical protein